MALKNPPIIPRPDLLPLGFLEALWANDPRTMEEMSQEEDEPSEESWEDCA